MILSAPTALSNKSRKHYVTMRLTKQGRQATDLAYIKAVH